MSRSGAVPGVVAAVAALAVLLALWLPSFVMLLLVVVAVVGLVAVQREQVLAVVDEHLLGRRVAVGSARASGTDADDDADDQSDIADDAGDDVGGEEATPLDDEAHGGTDDADHQAHRPPDLVAGFLDRVRR